MEIIVDWLKVRWRWLLAALLLLFALNNLVGLVVGFLGNCEKRGLRSRNPIQVRYRAAPRPVREGI